MILAQMGWGRGDLIDTGLAQGTLHGAVLGPRDADPSEIVACARKWNGSLKGKGLTFLDPQFYVTTIPSPKDGKLSEYPYYAPALTRASFGPKEASDYAKRVLEFQSTLDVTRWTSPTVLVSGFRDPWSQIALSLAQASIAEYGQRESKVRKPLLASFVVDELALRDRPALDEYLDSLTALEADGFYLIVRRNDPIYPANYEEDALVNLMYMTYVLGAVNSYEVVHGYTDIVGLLLLAVGAKAVATGWYSNLRQFSLTRFEDRKKGGHPPRERYTSRILLNSILVNPELAQIFAAGKLGQVLSKTSYDGALGKNPAGVEWPRRTSCLHHWRFSERSHCR